MKNKRLIEVIMLGVLLLCMLPVVENTNSSTEIMICGEEDIDEPWLD